ncbi:Mov34/MPN/PAD-1 family protein [Candidatus Uhrbacteria bacterium]|nr:Mov34/MPN/PAD-1 family protein [Candidatus Uhrbacteria bacterium]
MFPLYLKRSADDPPPEEPFAFIAGRSGFFFYKCCLVFRAVVPASEVPSLAPVQEEAEYLLPPVPAQLVAQVIAFFRAVYQQHRSEAILLLAYHPERKEFGLEAPSQTVTGAHCDHDMPVRAPEGWMYIGTIHSHGSMGAFHSGTDTHDEKFFDGIHCTIGRVDEPEVDIVATVAVSGRRFPQSVERVLGGVRLATPPEPEAAPVVGGESSLDAIIDWCQEQLPAGFVKHFNRGSRKRRFRRNTHASAVVPVSVPTAPWKYRKPGYVLELPPGTDPETCRPNPEWMTQVRQPPERTYPGYGMPYISWRWDAIKGEMVRMDWEGEWCSAGPQIGQPRGLANDDTDARARREFDLQVLEGWEALLTAPEPCGTTGECPSVPPAVPEVQQPDDGTRNDAPTAASDAEEDMQ